MTQPISKDILDSISEMRPEGNSLYLPLDNLFSNYSAVKRTLLSVKGSSYSSNVFSFEKPATEVINDIKNNAQSESSPKQRHEMLLEEFLQKDPLEARRSGKEWNIYKSGFSKPISLVGPCIQTQHLDHKLGTEANALRAYYAIIIWNAIYAKKVIPESVLHQFKPQFIQSAIEEREAVDKIEKQKSAQKKATKATSREHAIRIEWNKEERIIGKVYPLCVKYLGETVFMLALQKKAPVIHIVSLRAGRLIKGDDESILLDKYKLSANNTLTDTGDTCRADRKWLSLWTRHGFKLPTINIPLKEGDVFITLSGRQTSSFPKKYKRTNQYLIAIREWLKSEAILEAQHRGCDFNLTQWKTLNPKNWSTADGECVNQYLFGQADGRIGHLKCNTKLDYYIKYFELFPNRIPAANSSGWHAISVDNELTDSEIDEIEAILYPHKTSRLKKAHQTMDSIPKITESSEIQLGLF